MARTRSKEAVVGGDEEIGRRKRVNKNKDARPAKKAKVEDNKAAELPICVGRNLGRKRVNKNKDAHAAKKAEVEENKAAELPICVGRNLGDKAEGEVAAHREVLNDDELNKLRTHRDGNAESGDEGNRLRGLLADGPKKLSNKDVEDVIRYLEVDEIVSLTLKSGQGKGSDDGDTEEEGEEWIHQDDPNVASSEKAFDILRLMVGNIEKVKEVDLWLVYKKLPRSAFAALLLVALDSYSNRCWDGVPLLKSEDRDMITDLCRVLPWKLFAHILSYKTPLPLLESTSYKTSAESETECTPVQTSAELDEERDPEQLKEAAKSCVICLGKGQHSGLGHSDCSYLDSIPIGGTVGPEFWAACTDCGNSEYTQIVRQCYYCDCKEGKALLIPSHLRRMTRKATARFEYGLKVHGV